MPALARHAPDQAAEAAGGRRPEAEGAADASESPARTVSALIVTYWTGPLLGRCIASAAAQPHVKEILVVNNGNWPHALEKAVAVSPEGAVPVRIFSGHGNIGYASACNLGARHARGEHLLILNPDATLNPDAVERFLQEGAKLERPWLLGAKLINPDGSEQTQARRDTLTPLTAVVEALHLHRFAPKHPRFRRFNASGEPCPTETRRVPTISGACMFLHRADYDAIGGMDDGYFLHVEDIDFCLRFSHAGGGVYFSPHALATHHKSSSRAGRARIEFHKARSLTRYFRRHFSDTYGAFLPLFIAGLWLAFGLRAMRIGAASFAAWLGLAAQPGRAAKRFRRLARRRNLR